MADLRGILLAIEMATRQRDEHAKTVARAKRTALHAQAQMNALTGYAGETDQRWLGAGANQLSVEMMRHHYQFMDRLQAAINLQTQAIANAQRQVDLVSKTLLQAEHRLAGLKQVLASRQLTVQQQQLRREQRLTDEMASIMHARKLAANFLGESP